MGPDLAYNLAPGVGITSGGVLGVSSGRQQRGLNTDPQSPAGHPWEPSEVWPTSAGSLQNLYQVDGAGGRSS